MKIICKGDFKFFHVIQENPHSLNTIVTSTILRCSKNQWKNGGIWMATISFNWCTANPVDTVTPFNRKLSVWNIFTTSYIRWRCTNFRIFLFQFIKICSIDHGSIAYRQDKQAHQNDGEKSLERTLCFCREFAAVKKDGII